MFERYFPPLFASSALSFESSFRESICGGWEKEDEEDGSEAAMKNIIYQISFFNRGHTKICLIRYGAVQATRKHRKALFLSEWHGRQHGLIRQSINFIKLHQNTLLHSHLFINERINFLDGSAVHFFGKGLKLSRQEGTIDNLNLWPRMKSILSNQLNVTTLMLILRLFGVFNDLNLLWFT